MKLQIVALFTALSLSGCIVVSTKPDATKPYNSNAIAFKPSDVIHRVETKGQVICEPSKPCTEITFDWKRQPSNLYKVTADLYDQEQFNIERIVFQIDGQSYPYNASSKTSLRPVLNTTMTNSSNYIEVPTSFIDRFNSASEILVTVVTEKGEISHAILKDGQESFAYKTFKRGYSQSD